MSNSPRIIESEWGQIKTDDGGSYKDAKLFPGGSREWDWRETGTHHVPGIQSRDCEELIDNGAKIIILSEGHWKRLRVPGDTLDWLQAKGMQIHVLPTPQAVERYNELQNGYAVAGLFHSTC